MRWLLIVLLYCPSLFAFANVNVETKPDTVHVDAGAVPVNGTITATHNGELHPGAIPVSVRVDKDGFHGTATATLTTEKGTVEAPITLSTASDTIHVVFNVPKDAVHFEFSIPPHAFDNAFVVHAENTTQALEKPMQEIKAGLQGAFNETKFWIGIVAGGGVLLVIAIAIAHHYRYKHSQLVKGAQA